MPGTAEKSPAGVPLHIQQLLAFLRSSPLSQTPPDSPHEQGFMSRRRSSSPSSPAPAMVPPQLEDEDLLLEVLLRLGPHPSSLLRASQVCARWRHLVTDRAFLRRFRAHHRRNSPLLGFFSRDFTFTPTLRPPDLIPPSRFSLPQPRKGRFELLGCRHGLALLINRPPAPPRELSTSSRGLQAVVWDPITGRQRTVRFPPYFGRDRRCWVLNGAVLCASGDEGHVHGDCHSSPFRLVFVGTVEGGMSDMRALACLYESESGLWGKVISMPVTPGMRPSNFRPTDSVLVGSALHWMLTDGRILEFDLEKQTLDVIMAPADVPDPSHSVVQIFRTEENGLGFAMSAGPNVELWERKANCDGVVGWVFQKTVELDKLLLIRQLTGTAWVLFRGFVEDTNAILLHTSKGLFMVQLESMQFKHIYETDVGEAYYPYANFYTAGREVGDGNGVEMFNNA